jgi:hypothetical protein
VQELETSEDSTERSDDLGAGSVEARPRAPRKFFFSVLGTPSPVRLTFVNEPTWEKRGKGDALVAKIKRGDLDEEEMEQFAPDANDLSVALVTALGGTVAGKTCTISIETKPVPSRKTGGVVQVIAKFVVQGT